MRARLALFLIMLSLSACTVTVKDCRQLPGGNCEGDAHQGIEGRKYRAADSWLRGQTNTIEYYEELERIESIEKGGTK